MEFNSMNKECLQQIVDYLKTQADSIDSASVQINDSGQFIFRQGITYSETYTLEEFCDLIKQEVNKR